MAKDDGRSPSGRATHEQSPQAVSAVPVGIPSAVRDLTESGDFYSASPEAWERYRAAVNAGDWDEVLRHEQGEYGDFRYAP